MPKRKTKKKTPKTNILTNIIPDVSTFQSLTLTFSNGHKIKATVPTFCSEKEIESLLLLKVEISKPIPLPYGHRWGGPFRGVLRK